MFSIFYAREDCQSGGLLQKNEEKLGAGYIKLLQISATRLQINAPIIDNWDAMDTQQIPKGWHVALVHQGSSL